MNCNAIREKLILYIHNELSKDQENEIEKHIQDCQLCFNELQTENEIIKMVNSDKETLPEPDWNHSFEKIFSRIEKTQKQKIISLSFPIRKLKMIAALFLIFVAGAFIGKYFLSPQSEPFNISTFSSKKQFIEKTEQILISFSNQTESTFENFLLMEKNVIKEMLIQTQLLKSIAQKKHNIRFHKLLDELEFILMEISNIKRGNSRINHQLVKAIQRKDITFRLKLLGYLEQSI